jgi:hypothetical protein
MKHYWVFHGHEQCEICDHCGLRRRQRSAGFGKRITEYWLRGKGWTLVKTREPVPKCQGKGP